MHKEILLQVRQMIRDNGRTPYSNGERTYRDFGICYALYDLVYLSGHPATNLLKYEIMQKMSEWPGSLDPDYPVEGNATVFYTAYQYTDKWDIKTNYGRRRWELLEWLIEQYS